MSWYIIWFFLLYLYILNNVGFFAKYSWTNIFDIRNLYTFYNEVFGWEQYFCIFKACKYQNKTCHNQALTSLLSRFLKSSGINRLHSFASLAHPNQECRIDCDKSAPMGLVDKCQYQVLSTYHFILATSSILGTKQQILHDIFTFPKSYQTTSSSRNSRQWRKYVVWICVVYTTKGWTVSFTAD